MFFQRKSKGIGNRICGRAFEILYVACTVTVRRSVSSEAHAIAVVTTTHPPSRRQIRRLELSIFRHNLWLTSAYVYRRRCILFACLQLEIRLLRATRIHIVRTRARLLPWNQLNEWNNNNSISAVTSINVYILNILHTKKKKKYQKVVVDLFVLFKFTANLHMYWTAYDV